MDNYEVLQEIGKGITECFICRKLWICLQDKKERRQQDFSLERIELWKDGREREATVGFRSEHST